MVAQMHTVLGGSGAVGSAVVAELARLNLGIRVVERSKDVPGYPTLHADLLDPVQAARAVGGSSHVYLCIGVKYAYKTWKEQWPVVMKNVIDACAVAGAKLVFLDNVYMYGPAPLPVPFDESNPQDPPSRKGTIRKSIADTLLEAHRSGMIEAVIGRSADFYGPKAFNSLLYVSFLENMLKGKDPTWLAAPSAKHTYTYTKDAGRALVALALEEDTYGQAWHLPSGDPILPHEAADMFGAVLGRKFRVQYMPASLKIILPMFVPILGEVKEMSYQFNNDYVLSWEKFKKRFPGFLVTSYEAGIKETVESFSGDGSTGAGAPRTTA
jgi:nucleoside-diphosphate-sugar epimerase